MNITTKQFQKDAGLNTVWDFMTKIYDREKGGVAAPFLFDFSKEVVGKRKPSGLYGAFVHRTLVS